MASHPWRSLDSTLTRGLAARSVLRIPIAHAEGNYTLEADALKAVEDGGQVLLRYCEPSGEVSAAANPNGSLDNIAGLRNARGNVTGLMPHPERAIEPLLPSRDGEPLLRAFLS